MSRGVDCPRRSQDSLGNQVAHEWGRSWGSIRCRAWVLQAERARQVEASGSLLFYMDRSHKLLQLLLSLDFIN